MRPPTLIRLKAEARNFGNVAAMKPFRPLAVAISLSIVLASLPARADEVEKGRALAERLCASCHMGPGQGEKTSPNQIPGFAAVARRPNQTVDGIISWLQSVPPMMPDHHLTQDEMTALAAFIMSLKDAP